MNKTIILGCVADDYTGAADAASFIAEKGIPTILHNGIPAVEDIPDNSAVVIALKSRSIEPEKAVEESCEALRWLKANGAQRLYLKYCSTFDSTPRGNIGPVCDAALELLNQPYTLLCPALPVNGRTVREGQLYVNGVPLDETHMRNHPLNPMWSASIPELMEPQSGYPCFPFPAALLASGQTAVAAFIREIAREHPRFYLVPDYETEEQGKQLAGLFGDLPLATGGSAFAGLLAERAAGTLPPQGEETVFGKTAGRAVLLSGSCSEATREQIRAYEESGGKKISIDPADLRTGKKSVKSVWAEAEKNRNVLICTAEKGSGAAEHAGDPQLLERFMAELAGLAFEAGVTRFIVAGGETSGIVTRELGFRSFHVGPSVAPGIPVLIPMQDHSIRLILKSGNFGYRDFFSEALRLSGSPE